MQDFVQAHAFDAELFPEHEALAYQRLHEAVELPVPVEERPVEPADLVILAVGIVVAMHATDGSRLEGSGFARDKSSAKRRTLVAL